MLWARYDLFGKLISTRQQTPLEIMSEEHKMTAKDKLVLTITLAAIFIGVLGLGLVGIIVNLSS